MNKEFKCKERYCETWNAKKEELLKDCDSVEEAVYKMRLFTDTCSKECTLKENEEND